MPNSLPDRLRQDRPLITTFSILRSVESVEIVALAGFDAVILDMEHGPFGIETLGPLVLAAHARGIFAIARVLKNDSAAIGAALDAGADGVLVPQVSTAAEARAVVSAARFAPEGTRGANPYVRAANYRGTPEWFSIANANVAVIAMIEGRTGVENAADIIATSGLDAVFLGPVDLSHALGVPGQVEHPLVVEKMKEVMSQARDRSVETAVFSPTAHGASRWIKLGVKLVACGVDTGHLAEALQSVVASIREHSQEQAQIATSSSSRGL